MSNLETYKLEELFNELEVSSSALNTFSHSSFPSHSRGLVWAVMDARTNIRQAQQKALPSSSFALGATCLQFFNVYTIFRKTKQLRKITAA